MVWWSGGLVVRWSEGLVVRWSGGQLAALIMSCPWTQSCAPPLGASDAPAVFVRTLKAGHMTVRFPCPQVNISSGQ